MTTCELEVGGLIGDRWRQMGAENGPLGCPTGPEQDIGGGNSRQSFDRGEIAWSAKQEMIVTAYRLREYVCFDWTLAPTSLYNYEFWQINMFRDGERLGMNGTLSGLPNTHGRMRWRGIVKSCGSPVLA